MYRFTVRLPRQLEAKLKAEAAKKSITTSELARKILCSAIEDNFDFISDQETSRELPDRRVHEHLLRGVIGIEMMITKSLDPSRFVPQDEVKKAALIDILKKASEAATGILQGRDKK
jgi:hypothetical protein